MAGFRVALAVALGLLVIAPAIAAPSKEQWVETWGTAQPLVPAPRRPPPPPPAAGATPRPAPPSPIVPVPATVQDQTIRMTLRTSIVGSQLRLSFSNIANGSTVTIDSIHVARLRDGSTIDPDFDRVVTFSGSKQLVLQSGALVVSDPVNLSVPALTPLAVSIYLKDQATTDTVHALGLAPAFIAKGDQTAATSLPDAQLVRSYFWLTGVRVLAPDPAAGTIVALGDSITDGYATTPGANAAWPSLLAARLQTDCRLRHLGVVNMGISGNRVLRTGFGDSALARFDRDVLGRPGVKWLLLFEGINDINMSIIPGVPANEHVTADQIIAGLDQLATRARQHGIKVAAATIMPTNGLPFYSNKGKAMWQQVNQWIRTSGRFDAVFDFDQAARDPADPTRLRRDFDPGDHVHPNDAGNYAMADAIDLKVFR